MWWPDRSVWSAWRPLKTSDVTFVNRHTRCQHQLRNLQSWQFLNALARCISQHVDIVVIKPHKMCWKIFNCDWCLSSIKSKCDKSASKAFRNDTARNASTRLSEGVINCHKLLSQLWSTVTLQRVLGQLSSGLSQGVISCQNWNVWACDCLSSWLHLAPSVSTGLADGYDHLPTIYRPHALNCTFFRLSQYCPWLTSDLMAKPALAPAHRRRNLKMESPVGPK